MEFHRHRINSRPGELLRSSVAWICGIPRVLAALVPWALLLNAFGVLRTFGPQIQLRPIGSRSANAAIPHRGPTISNTGTIRRLLCIANTLVRRDHISAARR